MTPYSDICKSILSLFKTLKIFKNSRCLINFSGTRECLRRHTYNYQSLVKQDRVGFSMEQCLSLHRDTFVHHSFSVSSLSFIATLVRLTNTRQVSRHAGGTPLFILLSLRSILFKLDDNK